MLTLCGSFMIYQTDPPPQKNWTFEPPTVGWFGHLPSQLFDVVDPIIFTTSFSHPRWLFRISEPINSTKRSAPWPLCYHLSSIMKGGDLTPSRKTTWASWKKGTETVGCWGWTLGMTIPTPMFGKDYPPWELTYPIKNHLEGEPTRGRNNKTMVINHLSKSWDDPPSRHRPQATSD